MTITPFPHLHTAAAGPKPRDIIKLPLARTPEGEAQAMPALPLDRLGNDALRAHARAVIAELNRRGRAAHNAWDGPRVTLAENVVWLGEETRDARAELALARGETRPTA